MKKEYEAPKAERVEFDYSDSVVASSQIKCRNVTTYTEWNPVVNCQARKIDEKVGDV